jgi:hypothetical protein
MYVHRPNKPGHARRRWNFSPSPGWTKTEVAVLRLCLMVHGVGRWKEIECTGLLPGKLYQQLNGQTQRLLGQQSLAGDHACKHACHAVQLHAITGRTASRSGSLHATLFVLMLRDCSVQPTPA